MSYYNEMIADIIGASQSSLTYEQVEEMVTQMAVAVGADQLYILHCLKSVLDCYAAPYLESLDKLQSYQAPTEAETAQLQQDLLNMEEDDSPECPSCGALLNGFGNCPNRCLPEGERWLREEE